MANEPQEPVSNTKDTKGKKKFAFRDVRSTIDLLASGRLPLPLKFIKSNPVSKKLSKFTNKAKSAIAKGLNSKFMKSKLVSAATKAALGPIGAAVLAKVAGKVKIPGAGKIAEGVGKIKGSLGSIQKFARLASVGVSIAEQLNPNKIRRPIKEGLSASASAAAKNLAETVAASTIQSLLTGAPLASAMPTLPTPFKTAASLLASPRFFNPTGTAYVVDAKEKQTAETAVKHVTISTPDARLYPQRGLLEDELMYRLTLLAENVYAPAREYALSAGFGAVRILEGFRSENNAISQHELGEAIDITLGDGSLAVAQQCFRLAQWMRDHVLYDQLILCFDQSGGGQVWIHASFKIDGRRRQVMTKTYNDTHVPGLHIYTPAVGTDTETVANVATGEKFLNILAERQQRLQPVGLDTQLPQQKPLSPASISASGGDGADGGSDGERCLIDPFGNPYVANDSKRGIVLSVVADLLADPEFLAMAQDPDRRNMVPFAREVARRAGVGMNAVRGNRNDPSGDAIAIKNPTAGKGFGSWAPEDRVQVMDIVGGAHGPDPKPAWIDVTSVCAGDPGGGYIDP